MTLIASLLSSCGPSYPKERIAQSVEELCRKEYKIPVKARLVETTLGVLVSIPGLLEELMKQSGSEGPPPIPMLVEWQYQEQKFHFQFLFRGQLVRTDKGKPEREGRSPVDQERSKPLKMLDQVSTAMRRVALSTDARLEFYTLIAQDPGPANLELIFAGHLDDLKRVQYLDISLGELQRRSRISVRHQPEAAARQTVQMFLEDLTDRPLPQLLSRYVAPSRKFKELFPKILECAVELQGHTQDLLKGEWAVRQIQKDQVLVYVPLAPPPVFGPKGRASTGSESSSHLPLADETGGGVAPIGQTGATLFTVQIREGQTGLFDLERLQTDALPARFQTLGEPATWKGFFYLEPLVLSQFLSEQISKRVLSEFELLDRDKESKSKHPPKPVTDEEVSRVVVETSAYVLNSYRFSDFKGLTITDAVKGTRWVISAKDLPLYRRRNPPVLQPVS